MMTRTIDTTETAGFRRNLTVLILAQSLGAASGPIVISLGGLVSQDLATDPALATLPVSIYNLGLALGTVPAAWIMRQYGRRSGYLLGAMIGVLSGLVAAGAISFGAFIFFCLGTFLAGLYASYVQSYRFAAADGREGADRGRAISWVMVGGLIAAIIGPQLVIATRDAVPGVPFAGSFLSQAALALIAFFVLTRLRGRQPAATAETPSDDGGRTVLQLLASPKYMLGVAAGVVSYGLMSFVMTAAPLAMVGCGHSIDHAAWGIQWHVLAMFAPSLVTGKLIARFGKEKVTAAGLIIIGISGAVALTGLDLRHFFISLILLGVGWNFGFIGATAMVAAAHTKAERGRAQGLNDFAVFGTVAALSFFSGALMQASGWHLINLLMFPFIAIVLAPLVWQAARRL
ncbi:Riboflavin transporter RfnT [Sulfitobacter pontiacus]|jgi:MFS family permease|uniref:Riboflavin transporter RfnT n=1 Tax=Sulfitobacter pontiacus TaxID=60137 RepID=A0AAX3AGX8_9RHOB|nr:MFS transporter [Sulfitobacter pontiacus]UOA23873.1 Riboflavin transporter RfnT [Sulfitobacter pontiacus]WPZ24776.1 MFS transporter [Sulfitobacter pontiacus]